MTNSNLELSKELIDQIIFGMENQDHLYVFDLSQGKLLRQQDAEYLDEDADLLELPEWGPVNGFNLMESFVSELKNPLVRHDLQKILQSGRGVFRQFKNCLKEHREVEKLWFVFKERHMRQQVLSWFNLIRESRGLEALKPEIFEAEDLILSDFVIREVTDSADFERVIELDRLGYSEMYEDSDQASYWYSFNRDHLPAVSDGDNGSYVLAVYPPDEQLCGFLWILNDELTESKTISHVLQLYVQPRYRGLGIASTLVEKFLGDISTDQSNEIHFQNWTASDFLGPMLNRLGFKAVKTVYGRR